jgi:polysaccharide deacetylase 2 family uncharacterized protein YibQ
MLKALCWWLILLGYWLSAGAQAEARLAIIIDDIGYNPTQSKRAAQLNGKFTLAVLPFTPHALASAQLAHANGKELMLHLPMSAINHQKLGKGALVSGMGEAAFLTTLRQDLNAIPHLKGVNNHMGSRLTQEAEPMQWLMTELHLRGLYFVDSRTSAQTKALDIAKSHNVPSLKRDVFLDDSNEPGAIEHQLHRAINLARERGTAVAIGHPYPATLEILEKIEPLLQKQGVRLAYVSQLLSPKVAFVSPKPASSPLKDEGLIKYEESRFCVVPATRPLFTLPLFKSETHVDLYDKAGIMPIQLFGY